MIAFNQGGTAVEQRGTVVEYNGLGYIERTALGTWRSTGTSAYRFRMKNFVFDSTGKLSGLIVGTSDVTLSTTLNSFSGSGTAQIYRASGTLIGATVFTITGTRFWAITLLEGVLHQPPAADLLLQNRLSGWPYCVRSTKV
jgi:hypothetical protein